MADNRTLIDRNEIFPNGTFFANAEDPMKSLDELIARIWSIPTVDAVPVVRCKDCKHRGDETYCPMCFEEEIEWDDDGYSEWDWIVHDRTLDEGFCDRGERKDNEDNS